MRAAGPPQGCELRPQGGSAARARWARRERDHHEPQGEARIAPGQQAAKPRAWGIIQAAPPSYRDCDRWPGGVRQGNDRLQRRPRARFSLPRQRLALSAGRAARARRGHCAGSRGRARRIDRRRRSVVRGRTRDARRPRRGRCASHGDGVGHRIADRGAPAVARHSSRASGRFARRRDSSPRAATWAPSCSPTRRSRRF